MFRQNSKKKTIALMSAMSILLTLILIGVCFYIKRGMSSGKERVGKAENIEMTENTKMVVRPIKATEKLIKQNADELFFSWLKECKKRYNHSDVNLLACVRLIKLKEYLKEDYIDEVIIVRRKTAHLIFERLGRTLCSRLTEAKKDLFINKELKALYLNIRENLRQLKAIKVRAPSLELPHMKMCIPKNGNHAWAPL